MDISLHKIPIRDVATGYTDLAAAGVSGYNGMLNIRPAYQREFIYDEEKRNAVIDTIQKGYPLNVMYWIKNDVVDPDELTHQYEVLDGQQRTISFCQYVAGVFSLNGRYFHNLTSTEKDRILDYELMIYICEGTDIEKLEWFKIINIAGMKLTDQELRNAIYTGPWLADAKLKFSKPGCAAYGLANRYISGTPIRQEYLEKALTWISKGNIEEYMAVHQLDPNANELWVYFRNGIEWVEMTFTTYRSLMKGIDWGPLYDQYHGNTYDTNQLEAEISQLMIDDDVTNKRGIYPYVLEPNIRLRKTRLLNIRAFTEAQRQTAYDRQSGICPSCENHFELAQMHADHITPWSRGGKTIPENCQLLCAECNRRKSGI